MIRPIFPSHKLPKVLGQMLRTRTIKSHVLKLLNGFDLLSSNLVIKWGKRPWGRYREANPMTSKREVASNFVFLNFRFREVYDVIELPAWLRWICKGCCDQGLITYCWIFHIFASTIHREDEFVFVFNLNQPNVWRTEELTLFSGAQKNSKNSWNWCVEFSFQVLY